jgi:2-alkyl-3-oxoalkanoate reductase
MKVLVAGASGVVGRSLVPQLVERGHEVTGTTTRPANVDQIERAGAHAVLLDGLDGNAVRDAVRRIRPEAIISEMTALKGKPDFKHFDRWFAVTNALRTKGTEILLAAARETGTVERFVVQSYTGWTTEDTSRELVTEDEPFDSHPLRSQQRTLDAIRRQEALVLDAPLDGIVLRYANLYSAPSMVDSIRLLKKRQFPIVGDGAGVWSWLHAADAASATIAALENGKSAIYNVADDDPAPVNEWLPHLARVCGAPKPMRVPAWLAYLMVGDVGVRMMTRLRGVSNAKIKRELGWRPRYSSWRDGFARIVETKPISDLVRVAIS